MSSTKYLYEVGDTVIATLEDGQEVVARIHTVDKSDETLPYMVETNDANTQWLSFDRVRPATVPNGPTTMMAILDTIEGYARQARMLARAAESEANAPAYVAKGVCTKCFNDVTFNGRTGGWDHAEEVDHTPPAIVPRRDGDE